MPSYRWRGPGRSLPTVASSPLQTRSNRMRIRNFLLIPNAQRGYCGFWRFANRPQLRGWACWLCYLRQQIAGKPRYSTSRRLYRLWSHATGAKSFRFSAAPCPQRTGEVAPDASTATQTISASSPRLSAYFWSRSWASLFFRQRFPRFLPALIDSMQGTNVRVLDFLLLVPGSRAPWLLFVCWCFLQCVSWLFLGDLFCCCCRSQLSRGRPKPYPERCWQGW